MQQSRPRKALLLIVAGVLCLVAAGAIVTSFSGMWDKEPSGAVAGPAPGSAVEPFQTRDAEAQRPGELPEGAGEPWVIYITGAVLRPGVYRLPEGTRVYQAVEQAGGLSAEADPEAFNMALPLADGLHIHIPRKGEGPGPGSWSPGETRNGGKHLVDINSADSKVLESLPGIGPKTAHEIIRCREEQGRFKSVEDLLSVKGIGPSKLSAIRDLVTVVP